MPPAMHFDSWGVLPRTLIAARSEVAPPLDAPATLEVMLEGVSWIVSIHAAAVARAASSVLRAYPGPREEMILRAMHRLMITGDPDPSTRSLSGRQCSVSLYRLRTELAEQGHGFKCSEIVEALTVLTTAEIDVRRESGDLLFKGSLLKPVAEGSGFGAASLSVSFSNLTGSREDEQYAHDPHYKILMRLRPIAGVLYRSLQRSVAAHGHAVAVEIRLGSFVKQIGFSGGSRLRDAISSIRGALKELMHANCIAYYPMPQEVQSVGSPSTGRRPIVDVHWICWPGACVTA